MWKFRLLLLVPLATLILSGGPSASGFKTGAPGSPAICESMIPQHGSDPQKSALPYTIKLDKATPKGGEKVRITVGGGSEKFKGFYVMVKKAGDKKASYGKFDVKNSPLAQGVACFEKKDSAATHKDNSDKTEVTLDWIAPNEDLSDLEVVVSIAKNAGEYWTHRSHSEKVRVTRDANMKEEETASKQQLPESALTRLRQLYGGCDGTTKGCFGIPANCINDFLDNMNSASATACRVFVSWAKQGENNVFNLAGLPSSENGYVALGLSQDAGMGQDSVVGCYLDNGAVGIARSVNPGTWNEGVSNTSAGLVPGATGYDGGYIFCQFNQTNHEVGGVTIDFANSYHYLLAEGPTGGASGLTGKHPDAGRSASSEALLITDVGIVGGRSTSRLLYQLHGSFMITAWLLCASTGMFTARYYKLTFTAMMPLKRAFWFLIHQVCMFSTVFLSICGAIFIIVRKGGFDFKPGGTLNWHPVLGVILGGLAICQVVIAFFRPHPGTPKRLLFNWVHWIIGNSAHIIGIACIFLANDLSAANLGSDAYTFTMLGAVLFHIVMHLILSFHTLWSDKQMDIKTKRAVVPGPMKPNGSAEEAPGTTLRLPLLLFYFIGLLGCSAALIVMVVKPSVTS